MKTNTYIQSTITALSLLLFAACSPKSDETGTETTETKFSIPILDTKPENALQVKTAREQLKPGDQAIVFGQIGGVEEPFLDSYSGFVLADTELVFCNEMGDDDHCPMPWDACCEDPDKLKVSRVSVQLVGADGQPATMSLKGKAGLEPLVEVVVVGTVADSSTDGNLIINATGFYVGD